MSAHTSGEWTVFEGDTVMAGDLCVAIAYHQQNFAADAALIASAPELLEVAIAVAPILEALSRAMGSDNFAELATKVRSAISKASPSLDGGR